VFLDICVLGRRNQNPGTGKRIRGDIPAPNTPLLLAFVAGLDDHACS
jgi:hypothetical protein